MSKRFQEKLISIRHPDVIFWVCFFILNGLLFLPLYLLNQETTSFFPLSAIVASDTFQQLVLWRNNLDVFRLNAEIPLIMALWVAIPWLRAPHKERWFRWIFLAVYILGLSYYVYEAIMLSLYQSNPDFYSHYRLAIDGLQMVAHDLNVPPALYGAGVGGLFIGVLLIGLLVRVMFGGIPVERLSCWSRTVALLLAAITCTYLLTERTALASP
jgi:hypothetical protein